MADYLGMVVGVVISVLIEYVPGFNVWFDTLDTAKKRLITGAIVVAAALVIFGLGCAGWLEGFAPGLGVTCDQGGIQLLVKAIVTILVGSQAAFVVAFQGNKDHVSGSRVSG